jgi:hypothetical protein
MKFFMKGMHLDFEAPIHLEEDQFNNFVSFMKKLLNENVEIKNITEKHKVMSDIQRSPKNWSTKEFFLLLSPMSNEELEKKLERTNMSIVMMRGHFVPGFMSWARKKGYDSSKITETVIKQFLEEEKNDNS